KLGMQWSNNQAGIQPGDIAPQDRFQPSLAGGAIERVALIACAVAAMFDQLRQKSYPVFMSLLPQQTPARSFNAKPHSILAHHPAQSRERQTVISERFAVAGTHDVDCFGSLRHNCPRRFASLVLKDWWKTRQPFPP